MSTPTGRCGRCKEDIPLSDYSKGTETKKRSYCKPCNNAVAQAWRLKHPGMMKIYQQRERIKNPLKFRWGNIVKRAAQKGWAVMSRAEFIAWFTSQKKECSYCGIGEEMARVLFKFSLAIDRKDNKIGYTLKNVTLACHRCNSIKSSFLSYDQMMKVAAMFFGPNRPATSFESL